MDPEVTGRAEFFPWGPGGSGRVRVAGEEVSMASIDWAETLAQARERAAADGRLQLTYIFSPG